MKNRYHKFKDKIVELWQALEAYTGDDLLLRDRALAQLDEYRKACDLQAATPKKDGASVSSVTPKTPGSIATPRGDKVALTARRAPVPLIHSKWGHLDEAAALESLPEPLKNLLHVRNLVQELGAGNKLAMEEQYDKALQAYLKEIPESKEALFEKSLALAFLFRCALGTRERRDLSVVYERVVNDYLVAISTTFTSV